MTTLAWPALTITPQRAEWSFVGLTQVHESPISGAVQTQEIPGGYWSCVLDYGHARGDNARLLWAFVQQMAGRAGRVAVPVFGYERPSGVGGGAPVVSGAGQTGKSLAIAGAPVSTTGWLQAGDLFGVGGYIYRLTADVDTSVAGAATLTFGPSLRAAPTDGAALTLRRPTTTMMFVDDRQGSSFTPGGVVPFVLTFREAFT